MRITIDIKDSKATSFINFIKSLDFIKIQSSEDLEEPTKQEILDSIEQGLKEVQMHQEGKIELKSARDFINEL